MKRKVLLGILGVISLTSCATRPTTNYKTLTDEERAVEIANIEAKNTLLPASISEFDDYSIQMVGTRRVRKGNFYSQHSLDYIFSFEKNVRGDFLGFYQFDVKIDDDHVLFQYVINKSGLEYYLFFLGQARQNGVALPNLIGKRALPELSANPSKELLIETMSSLELSNTLKIYRQYLRINTVSFLVDENGYRDDIIAKKSDSNNILLQKAEENGSYQEIIYNPEGYPIGSTNRIYEYQNDRDYDDLLHRAFYTFSDVTIDPHSHTATNDLDETKFQEMTNLDFFQNYVNI